MPGRIYNGGNYRYGMNGMEKDDEIVGSGNMYNFGARIYDPRLGKWLSIDPLHKKYPGYSPYSFGLDNPIYFKDGDGRVIIDANGKVVTVNQDSKGNITFNADIAPATQAILNNYLTSNVGKAQLKQMDATVTKITLQESQMAAFMIDENGEYELVLGYTDTKGKAKEANGEKTYESANITVYKGSIDLQSQEKPTIDANGEYVVYGDEGPEVVKGKDILGKKNKQPIMKPESPGPHQTRMMKDKTYAQEATYIHESEHTSADQYKTEKAGGDIEQGPIQKEKDYYQEKNPK